MALAILINPGAGKWPLHTQSPLHRAKNRNWVQSSRGIQKEASQEPARFCFNPLTAVPKDENVIVSKHGNFT